MLQCSPSCVMTTQMTGPKKDLPPVLHFRYIEKTHHGNKIFVPRFQCPLCFNWYSLNHPLDHFKRDHQIQVTSTLEIPGLFHEAVAAARKREMLPSSPENDKIPASSSSLTKHVPNGDLKITYNAMRASCEPWKHEEDVAKQLFLLADTSSLASVSTQAVTDDEEATILGSTPLPHCIRSETSCWENSICSSQSQKFSIHPSSDHKRKYSTCHHIIENIEKETRLLLESDTQQEKKSNTKIEDSHSIKKCKLVTPTCKKVVDHCDDIYLKKPKNSRHDYCRNETCLSQNTKYPIQPLWHDMLFYLIKETGFQSMTEYLQTRQNKILKESKEIERITEEIFKKQHLLSNQVTWLSLCLQQCLTYEDVLEKELSSIRSLSRKLQEHKNHASLQVSNTQKLVQVFQSWASETTKMVSPDIFKSIKITDPLHISVLSSPSLYKCDVCLTNSALDTSLTTCSVMELLKCCSPNKESSTSDDSSDLCHSI